MKSTSHWSKFSIILIVIIFISCTKEKQKQIKTLSAPTVQEAVKITKLKEEIKAPSIMPISNQLTYINSKNFIPFKILDTDDNFSCAKKLTATSSNTSLIPISNIKFYGIAPDCVVEVVPAPDLVGASDLSLVLGGTSQSISFRFEVRLEMTNAPVLKDSQKDKQSVNQSPPTMFPKEVGKMPENPSPPTMFPKEVGKMPKNPSPPTMFPTK